MKTIFKTILSLVVVEIVSLVLAFAIITPIGWALYHTTSVVVLIVNALLGSLIFWGVMQIVLPLTGMGVVSFLGWCRLGRLTAIPLGYGLYKLCNMLYLLFCVIWQFDLPADMIVEDKGFSLPMAGAYEKLDIFFDDAEKQDVSQFHFGVTAEIFLPAIYGVLALLVYTISVAFNRESYEMYE